MNTQSRRRYFDRPELMRRCVFKTLRFARPESDFDPAAEWDYDAITLTVITHVRCVQCSSKCRIRSPLRGFQFAVSSFHRSWIEGNAGITIARHLAIHSE